MPNNHSTGYWRFLFIYFFNLSYLFSPRLFPRATLRNNYGCRHRSWLNSRQLRILTNCCLSCCCCCCSQWTWGRKCYVDCAGSVVFFNPRFLYTRSAHKQRLFKFVIIVHVGGSVFVHNRRGAFDYWAYTLRISLLYLYTSIYSVMSNSTVTIV